MTGSDLKCCCHEVENIHVIQENLYHVLGAMTV